MIVAMYTTTKNKVFDMYTHVITSFFPKKINLQTYTVAEFEDDVKNKIKKRSYDNLLSCTNLKWYERTLIHIVKYFSKVTLNDLKALNEQIRKGRLTHAHQYVRVFEYDYDHHKHIYKYKYEWRHMPHYG